MQGHTRILGSRLSLDRAHKLIEDAPYGSIMTVREAKRTPDQNAKMWAMLSDISAAKPEGRMMTPEVWKSAFMQAIGHELRFEQEIDGGTGYFPCGFKTSRLTKSQMADLITFIQEYGDRHGVVWSNEADSK